MKYLTPTLQHCSTELLSLKTAELFLSVLFAASDTKSLVMKRVEISGPSTEREPIIRAPKRTIYTAGRPPWYDSQGQQVEPFVIGICGGSASGKTTVANKIISELDVPWVTLLSMDSFYKVLNENQHRQAAINEVR